MQSVKKKNLNRNQFIETKILRIFSFLYLKHQIKSDKTNNFIGRIMLFILPGLPFLVIFIILKLSQLSLVFFLQPQTLLTKNFV